MDPSVAADEVLERVHAELRGPIRFPVIENSKQVIWSPEVGKAHYVSLVIDEKSRKCLCVILARRNVIEAAPKIQQWIPRVEREIGRRLKVFHSDDGSEYTKLNPYLARHGIEHTVTEAYTTTQWHRRETESDSRQEGSLHAASCEATSRHMALGIRGGELLTQPLTQIGYH
jgi:hypothetical protein